MDLLPENEVYQKEAHICAGGLYPLWESGLILWAQRLPFCVCVGIADLRSGQGAPVLDPVILKVPLQSSSSSVFPVGQGVSWATKCTHTEPVSPAMLCYILYLKPRIPAQMVSALW